MASQSAPEHVTFVPETAVRERAAAAFELHRRRLAELLPGAEIHHVGSTAVPGSLTKGDLDIHLRVTGEQLAQADATLTEHYARNASSTHTATFSSFKDDKSEPPLGIQLTAMGGPEDHFCRLRDYLIAHPATNAQYNALKRRFEGAAMDEYRAVKAAFLSDVFRRLDA